jgi:zinc protease
MRRSACATLLALLACSPRMPATQTPESSSAPLPADRLQVLKNTRPVVELRVVFEAGSADDPAGHEGLAALTQATMLEGRAGGLSYAERERKLFPMAAEIEGFVERQQTTFTARVHKDHVSAFYPLFRDLLAAPAFDVIDFERVRARNLSALTKDLRGADDERLGKELLQAMLFEGHPFGVPVLGTERGIKASNNHDARAFWQHALCAGRVRAVVSGDVSEQLASDLSHDLGALGGAACTDGPALSSPTTPDNRRMWVVDKPEAQSVAISLGVNIDVTRAHPDYAALMLATAYLGQHRTFAGRLMQKLRADRGLNYGDYAYAEHFVQDGGSRFPLPNVARRQQYFSIWLRPVPPDRAHFALRMAVRELESFVRDGISVQDFARIKHFAEQYFLLFAQTEQERLGELLDDAFYGTTGPYLDKLCAQFHALTRDDVNQAIRRHLHPERLQIALVAANAAQLADNIVGNVPSPITYQAEKAPEILAEDKQIEVYPVGVARDMISILPLAHVFE